MDRIKQKLGVEISKQSVNKDTFLKLNIENSSKILPTNDINKVINLGDRFNVERQRSSFYRILGTINPIMSNVLFNLNDINFANKQTFAGFNDYSFLDASYPKNNNLSDLTDINFLDSISSNLKEVNGWFGYFNPIKSNVGLCDFFDMEPSRERFSFIPDTKPFSGSLTPVKNWELTITYPSSTDSTHNIVNGGLLIINALSVTSSTRTMVAFGVACKHNLSVGTTVKITGTTGYDGSYDVVRLGLDNGDLIDYYFVIDLPPTGIIDGSSRMVRVYGGQDSEYYFRKFRKIKTRITNVIGIDDYETYKLSFSENSFSDSISQFVFNEDIDISELTDNLGRPLTELYLTTIKTDSDSLFSSVSSGIDTPFMDILISSNNTNPHLRNVPVINRIHNGTTPFTSHIPLETNININNVEFYGDLVEFNKFEVKETVLIDVTHRFNTNNRETGANISYVSVIGESPITTNIDLGPRQEGYVYKPHSLITIRSLSSYIEQGDTSVVGIPDYATDLGDGRFLWRDILDIGFNENGSTIIDYPFLNGCHYMYQNSLFYVKRQDAFSQWGLFYSKFPADPIGEQIINNFTINSENNVC